MRLIDADALKKDLESVTLSNGTLVNTNTILRLLEVYPTAYNVDKVVEHLEELKRRYDIKKFGIKGVICKAIEIVKGGGVNDRE